MSKIVILIEIFISTFDGFIIRRNLIHLDSFDAKVKLNKTLKQENNQDLII
jgi:hypothetical protein